MVNGGLFKVYVFFGFWLGWLVGLKEIIEDSWGYYDYMSIMVGILSYKVGEIVL